MALKINIKKVAIHLGWQATHDFLCVGGEGETSFRSHSQTDRQAGSFAH